MRISRIRNPLQLFLVLTDILGPFYRAEQCFGLGRDWCSGVTNEDGLLRHVISRGQAVVCARWTYVNRWCMRGEVKPEKAVTSEAGKKPLKPVFSQWSEVSVFLEKVKPEKGIRDVKPEKWSKTTFSKRSQLHMCTPPPHPPLVIDIAPSAPCRIEIMRNVSPAVDNTQMHE